MLRRAGFLALALISSWSASALAEPPAKWWSDDVEQALAKAKDNRPELEKALADVPKDQRKGMAFLIANMPDGDLKSLKADFLLTNTRIWPTRRASEVPWGKDIPEDIFLNDVLPYANVDEKRDAWRKEFYDLCLPIVKDCKTPRRRRRSSTRELFKKLKLGYSTQRKAPNQSPKESIEQGKASCTGLSIVLSDACRAVCVPARLVGTPLWANKRGNHTWVEIWDKDWHFTGACEPDPNGLDRGWFVGDAAQAKKDVAGARHLRGELQEDASSTSRSSGRCGNKDVPAENVTDHYAKIAPDTKPDTGRSAEALKALRTAVEAGPEALAELVRGDIRQDAADQGRRRDRPRVALEGPRRHQFQKDRAAEVKDRVAQGRQAGDALLLQDLRQEAGQAAGACGSRMHGGGGAPKERQRSAVGEPEEALHAR